jgi:hypothetical protein
MNELPEIKNKIAKEQKIATLGNTGNQLGVVPNSFTNFLKNAKLF